MIITNYHVSITGNDVLILTGGPNSTVIKSLEIISSDSSAEVTIYRKDSSSNVYGSIKVNLEAYNYLMLWEGFISIPKDHTLWVSSVTTGIEVVANVVEL